MLIHGTRTERSRADAEDVRALYLAVMDGWNRGSAAAFAAPFADEADFIAFDGTRFHGRDDLVRFHEPLFGTHLRGTRLTGDVTDIRFLSADMAVMHARGGTVLRGKRDPAPERDSIQTLAAVRRDGRWQLVAFQNTRVRPIGQNLAGTLLWLWSDWLWRWCLPKKGANGTGLSALADGRASRHVPGCARS
jgi:uncharacterized protein (TIGR02246 family)